MSLTTGRKTKIVATLGPSSFPRIAQMIDAGVNVFRLNFSHTDDPTIFIPYIRQIRAISESGLHIGILGDLCGPKIRCNKFDTPSITLTKGQQIELCVSSENGNANLITTSIASLCENLELNHSVLFDDGSIRCKVIKLNSPKSVTLEVIVGGELKPKKGINVPDVRINTSPLTDKDKKDVVFAIQQKLDFVALSFVQKAADITELIEYMKTIDPFWSPQIIAKIEKPQAIEDIDAIIALVTGGIMVARGDLGVEASLENLPLFQKMLIRKANLAEKIVITATQMLESMIEAPTPTRAEVSDVANSVFDGTDAVMLSAESASGKYPIESVEMMSKICVSAESGDKFMHPHPVVNWTFQDNVNGHVSLAHPIADSAVSAASNAKAIVTVSQKGNMPRFLSKRRPAQQIIAFTSTSDVCQGLALHYGVIAVCSDKNPLKMKEGDVLVYCSGFQENSFSYSIKIAAWHPNTSIDFGGVRISQ